MVWMILAMVLCLALAAAVVGVVAVPARREGRQVLTPKGEEVISSVARSTDRVVSSTKERAGSVVRGGRAKEQPRHAAGSQSEAPAREAS